VTQNIQRHNRAGRGAGYQVSENIWIIYFNAIEASDNIPLPQASSLRGAARLHLSHSDTPGLLDPQVLCGLGIQLHYGNAKLSATDLSDLDERIRDRACHVRRNRKADADAATGR